MNHYESKENNSADCHVYPRFSEPGTLRGFTVTTARPPLEAPGQVHTRLVEAGLPAERFVDLQDGTKEPTASHTDPANQFGAEHVDGNYGIMPRGNLVFVDVDNWSALPSQAKDLLDGYPTFTVTTPHADEREGHYWFIVDGDINDAKFEWGEIRASGWYVVGPGSEITDCTHGCCTPDTPGRYERDSDQPIARIPSGEFRDVLIDEEGGETTTVRSPTNSFTGNLNSRIERGLSENEDFRELWEWAKRGGNPAEVGFPDGDDGEGRSGAETALGAHLMFWLSGDWNAVREAFNQVRSPKWSESGESYKQSLLEDADNGDYYNPEREGNGISFEAIHEVAITFQLWCEGRASTAEIVEQDPVHIQRKQTQKVLDHFEQKGYIHYEREGRTGEWVVDDSAGLLEYARSDHVTEEFNSRQDWLDWCRENL